MGKELSKEEICKQFIYELTIKIERFAEKESSEFNRHVHFSYIGDLNKALQVIELYTQKQKTHGRIE